MAHVQAVGREEGAVGVDEDGLADGREDLPARHALDGLGERHLGAAGRYGPGGDDGHLVTLFAEGRHLVDQLRHPGNAEPTIGPR